MHYGREQTAAGKVNSQNVWLIWLVMKWLLSRGSNTEVAMRSCAL